MSGFNDGVPSTDEQLSCCQYKNNRPQSEKRKGNLRNETAELQLTLDDCSEIVYERDLPRINQVWTKFVNINWLDSSCRDDVKSVRIEGAVALSHLLPVALNNTNQSHKVAGFLLNLYNGSRFPFDMTLLRGLDHELFVDCITVLMMNSTHGREIHNYVERGQEIWERMAMDWGYAEPQDN